MVVGTGSVVTRDVPSSRNRRRDPAAVIGHRAAVLGVVFDPDGTHSQTIELRLTNDPDLDPRRCLTQSATWTPS